MSESDSLTPIIQRTDFDRILAALLDLRAKPKLLIPYFAREANWHMNGDLASWAYAGQRCSRDSIVAYLQAFSVEFEQSVVQRFESVIDGEQACMRYELRLRHRGTRRSDVLPCLCFIRVEGALIVEVHEFIDSATLFRLRESLL